MNMGKDRKIALVPWEAIYNNDALFDSNNTVLNRDNCALVFTGLREYLNKYNWQIHTIDLYANLCEVDVILFFSFDLKWYKIIKTLKLLDRTIYMAWEPPVVDINHFNGGIRLLKKYFKYILTWNDKMVDNKRIFKYMYPYYFEAKKSNVAFEQKKLLVNISNNKFSYVKNELYSERKKVISYFDSEDGFSLYGSNWDANKIKSYKGKAASKKEVYYNFKFALSLENMKNIDGYITEKIFDCFCAGTVPIYWGAQNIDKYIPKDCYISYCDFKSLNELRSYIVNMKKDEYQKFVDKGQQFINSDAISPFQIESLGSIIRELSENISKSNFKLKGRLLEYKLYRLFTKLLIKMGLGL